jgi:hypothetical protein
MRGRIPFRRENKALRLLKRFCGEEKKKLLWAKYGLGQGWKRKIA